MLHRFQIELSDIDRGVYESLDFRVAQHPSETYPYLLTRVLAYCLMYQEHLEFTPGGLADPDEPALKKEGIHNSIELWIEIGNPSIRKLHKATKVAKEVLVFTYKNGDLLKNEISAGDVHRGSDIRIVSIPSGFLEGLSQRIEKNNRWSLLIQQDQCDVTIGNETIVGFIHRH